MIYLQLTSLNRTSVTFINVKSVHFNSLLLSTTVMPLRVI